MQILILILTTPETFRVAHPSMSSRKYRQLTEFAEIIAPRYIGVSWITDRFGVLRKVVDKFGKSYE